VEPKPPPPPSRRCSETLSSPPLDISKGLAACAGISDLHRQIVLMLAADISGRVSELERMLATVDATQAGRMAHKHKGACLAVGAQELAELFAAIDMACRAGDLATARAQAAGLPAARDAFRTAAAALAAAHS
jgi:HPt (histidine-containing phosphotransfer) domain-containing protein